MSRGGLDTNAHGRRRPRIGSASGWRRGPLRRGSLGLLLALFASAGAAAEYAQAPRVLRGDPAPGSGGGTIGAISGPTLGSSGTAAFHATVVGGEVGEGVFRVGAGLVSAVALPGETAPGTGGGTYASFGPFPAVGGLAAVAFRADVIGGSVGSGVFVGSGGADVPVALAGETAPGTGGGTYSAFDPHLSMNAAGDVVFVASVAGGSASAGVFVQSGGVADVVALVGEPAPGTGSGTYSSFARPKINGSGEIAFAADLAGSAVTEGLFRYSGGMVSAAALHGETAPGTGGGTYLAFGDTHALGDAGEVAFRAPIAGGTVGIGVFVDAGGVDEAVALFGDTAPGTGGGTFFGFSAPALAGADAVAFVGTATGGTASQGVFVRDPAGTFAAVLGPTAPGTGGGAYGRIDSLTMNAPGDLVYRANVGGGSTTQGVFEAKAPRSVPALGPGGAAIASIALALSGALALRSVGRRPRDGIAR